MRGKKANYQSLPSGDGIIIPRIVVKFPAKSFGLPYEDNVDEQFREALYEWWARIAKDFPGLHLKRLYTSIEPSRIRELVAQAKELDPSYKPVDFLSYYVVEVLPEYKPEMVLKTLSPKKGEFDQEIVEHAYLESSLAPLPAPPTGSNPDLPLQHYLKPAANNPSGIDAQYAWGITDSNNIGIGAGKGVSFLDVELGWNLNHVDLAGANINLLSGINGQSQDEISHGTRVLGVLAAQDNTVDGVGIAYEATGKVVSGWRAANTLNWSDAILAAIDNLTFGDVLLLEAQISLGGTLLPLEFEAANFDAIRLATALGITVVEAAGNGGVSLDTKGDSNNRQIFNKNSQDFRDSGAILVGSADPMQSFKRKLDSNFGERLNCFAWGNLVSTIDVDANGRDTFINSFSATSAASAIVAGAAIVLQGIVKHHERLGFRLSAFQMRNILSDRTVGVNTPSQNPAQDQIGVMPNLRKIIDSLVNLVPDVVIRDHLGDTGDPHTGSISDSPDVIVRPAGSVANPQAAFGGGNPNFGNTNFSEPVGQGDHEIFVRVFNRGGISAADVTATVYWSPSSTLIVPAQWTKIGTSTPVNVTPSVSSMTVLHPILWNANQIPAPGHYCFVATIGCPGDPNPIPDHSALAQMPFDDYCKLVRLNNNITWKNFNVLPLARGNVELDFLAPGAFDEERQMQLEVVAHLPDETKLELEGPAFFLNAMLKGYLEPNVNEKSMRLPLSPYGVNHFQEMIFPAGSQNQLRLLLELPDKNYDTIYEVYVRHLFLGEEVGRITWQFVPGREV